MIFTVSPGHVLYNQTFNGAYTFTNIDALLARNPSAYQQFTGTGSLDLAVNEVGIYAQDEWHVLPGLTISPGLRYEAQFNPNYLDATAPQYRFPLATSIPNDTKMIAPRLGLAWDIGNSGRTVVRAGGGLFHAATYLSILAKLHSLQWRQSGESILDCVEQHNGQPQRDTEHLPKRRHESHECPSGKSAVL